MFERGGILEKRFLDVSQCLVLESLHAQGREGQPAWGKCREKVEMVMGEMMTRLAVVGQALGDGGDAPHVSY